MSETARLAVVVACYGGLGASLVFHGIWFRIAGARLVEHVRAHHGESARAAARPLPIFVWNRLFGRSPAMESCDDFVRLRRAARLVVISFATTSLVLLATAQAFWSTLS
jgi:hypothetical protein